MPPSGSSTIGVGTERGAKARLALDRLVAVLELGALTGNRDGRRLVVVRPLLRGAVDSVLVITTDPPSIG